MIRQFEIETMAHNEIEEVLTEYRNELCERLTRIFRESWKEQNKVIFDGDQIKRSMAMANLAFTKIEAVNHILDNLTRSIETVTEKGVSV